MSVRETSDLEIEEGKWEMWVVFGWEESKSMDSYILLSLGVSLENVCWRKCGCEWEEKTEKEESLGWKQCGLEKWWLHIYLVCCK